MATPSINEVLRREWQELADEIAAEDPHGLSPHMNDLRLHAQRRADEYASRAAKETIDWSQLLHNC